MADEKPLVSVIIDNYNYGRFLGEAIESALEQTWQATEVIAVDDGSTDNSAEVISRYREHVLPVLKMNGGQGSAFNEGFRFSHGDIVIFLDSDDRLLPNAAERAVAALSDHRASRAYWPMQVIDEHGQPTGESTNEELPEGDLSEQVLSGGPYMYRWSPTSGNAWRRSFLEAVFPVPEAIFTNFVDNFLSSLSPLYGTHKALESLACYRSHQLNETKQFVRMTPFLPRLNMWLEKFDACLAATREHCSRLGLAFDEDLWKANSWFHRIERAVSAIECSIPDTATFILADRDSWQTGGSIKRRRALPFLERSGGYWGQPPDSATAIAELERMRAAGAQFLALSWSCFWWLDHYAGLEAWLDRESSVVHKSEDIQIFRFS